MSEFIENRKNKEIALRLLEEQKKKKSKPRVQVEIAGAVFSSSKFSSSEEFRKHLDQRLNEDGARLKVRAKRN